MNTYSYAEVEAAMCAWEHILDTKKLPKRLEKYRQSNGASALRQACIELAPWIEQVWVKFGDNTYLSFDWEFVPYLMGLATWPDDGTWPTHPPAEFAAKLVEFRFDNSILRG
jgi:hypothetical protein